MPNEDGSEIPQSAIPEAQAGSPSAEIPTVTPKEPTDIPNNVTNAMTGENPNISTFARIINKAKSVLGMRSSSPSQTETPTPPTQQTPGTPTK